MQRSADFEHVKKKQRTREGFVEICRVKNACVGECGERERALDEMTRGDKGKLLIRFVPLFTLSLVYSARLCAPCGHIYRVRLLTQV